jgi:magnesium transporter
LFKVIGKFRLEIKDVENQLFTTNTSKDLLLEIIIIKRNLINYISIISPLLKVITELETKYKDTITENGLLKVDDSLDKIEKILNNLANYRDQITLLKETEQSLVARSTNDTVKKLTGINLLIFVPTLVTSFFGMNVYF